MISSRRPLKEERSISDDDIATIHFRNPIALVSNCLDRHVANLALLNRWFGWTSLGALGAIGVLELLFPALSCCGRFKDRDAIGLSRRNNLVVDLPRWDVDHVGSVTLADGRTENTAEVVIPSRFTAERISLKNNLGPT